MTRTKMVRIVSRTWQDIRIIYAGVDEVIQVELRAQMNAHFLFVRPQLKFVLRSGSSETGLAWRNLPARKMVELCPP